MSETASTARLDALTDGVVAIVITLLVLDLRLPEDVGTLDGAAIRQLLSDMAPQFRSYVFSFAVVGLFWVNHVQCFRGLRGSTGGLTWLTLLFLATLTLVPFTTALMSRSDTGIATAIYAAGLMATSALLAMIALHIDRHRLSGDDSVPASWEGMEHFAQATVFAVSIPLAFYSTSLAQLFWLLLIPLSLVQVGRRLAK